MLRWASPVPWALAALAAGALVATCADPPDSGESGPAATYSREDTADLLPGTWLREYEEEGVQVRRLMVLEAGGEFREVSRVVDASGQAREFVNAGTWLFDGTNLKRRYTSMDGKPPSRLTTPFVTLEIAFQSRNEFTGVDHIHDRTIRYQRVPSETEL